MTRKHIYLFFPWLVLHTFKAIFSFTANILIFLNGIHVGWPSPSLRKMFSEDYPFIVTENEGSYIVIISYIGDIIGGICGCSLINLIGRKNTLLSITVPYTLSFLLISFSNYGTIYLYFARVLGKSILLYSSSVFNSVLIKLVH